MKMRGYSEFETHKVWDKDVYKLVVEHSTFLDRLNPKKMVEMTLWAHTFLANVRFDSKNKNWSFYGKNGFFTEDRKGTKTDYTRKEP